MIMLPYLEQKPHCKLDHFKLCHFTWVGPMSGLQCWPISGAWFRIKNKLRAGYEKYFSTFLISLPTW